MSNKTKLKYVVSADEEISEISDKKLANVINSEISSTSSSSDSADEATATRKLSKDSGFQSSPSSGNEDDGVWSCTVTIPRGAEPGPWELIMRGQYTGETLEVVSR